jgi:N-acetylmuramoyl-L-alanine amidase
MKRIVRPAAALFAIALPAWFAGCAGPVTTTTTTTTEGGVPIETRFASRAQDSRAQFLILHYTAGDLATSLMVLTNREVSAHYLVSDESPPRIYRLVPEARRAWHSGASGWKGHRLLNAGSIGIEIVHPGFVSGPDGQRIDPPFPQAQIDAVIELVRDVVARHGIRTEHVLGHGEVSPSYKEDPGPAFPWPRLAERGLVPPLPDAARVAARRALYESALPDLAWFQRKLAEHGYPIDGEAALDGAQQRALLARVLMNFQMRYRPARFDGLPDAESAAILWVLTTPEPRP